ncbi:MAG: 2-oxo acid dehydrogenase subunit E2 [Methanobacteriota archaeon]
MNRIGTYEKKPFTLTRQNITLISGEGKKRLAVHSLIELDVTSARERIRLQKENGCDISFTGWIIKCVAQAVHDHPSLNAYRQGRRKMVIFDDVDIPIPIERDGEDDSRVLPYIIRRADKKTVLEITQEIRAVQHEKITDKTQVLGKNLTRFERWIVHAPLFIKKLLMRMIRYQGVLKKKYIGTVGVTSIGMKGRFSGWVIPLGGPVAVLCVVCGIQKKPGVVDNRIEIREYLHMTVTVDHAVIDGGPLARFLDRLTELIENAHGLSE